MSKDEALKLALEALECLYHGDTEHTYEALECGDAAIAAIKEVLAQPVQESTRPCRSCGGTGERYTGIDEYPTTICKPCDGTGQIAMAEQPEPVMDYDKEELRGTVWDTNKQSLVQLEEDFCFCDDNISLQIVSGGAAVGGLYSRVTLKIKGEYVDYVREQPERPQNCGSGFCSCIECVMEPAQEPVAWMHDAEGRVDVIHSEVKALWIKVGQPSGFYREKVPCKVEHYTIPLFTSPRMREHITDGTECWCTPIVESALKEKREWVGLSETEVRGEFPHSNYPWFFQTVLAIETMLKEKNA